MSASPLRIVFAGTPEFAHFILGALLDAPDCEVLAAYTPVSYTHLTLPTSDLV